MTDISSAYDDYNTYANYSQTGVLADAQAFETACRRLLALPIASRSRAGAELSFSTASIEKALASVQRWIANKQRGAAGGYRFGDLRGFDR